MFRYATIGNYWHSPLEAFSFASNQVEWQNVIAGERQKWMTHIVLCSLLFVQISLEADPERDEILLNKVALSVCWSVRFSIDPVISINLLIHSFIRLSIYPFIDPYIPLPINPTKQLLIPTLVGPTVFWFYDYRTVFWFYDYRTLFKGTDCIIGRYGNRWPCLWVSD